ncbi:hypothetical protein F9L07_25265 [Pimelobacter simplex]|uniref:Phage tail length tape-measure protein n=1 Tax=Nocardioides simplex TaxID=2045 RepID=A0A7J5DSL1_NOCSI|nr:hypothetical protein F9L07_25265 [Pimelobacter simplex]
MATRRERVIVSLDDDYSGPMARCVGATALLNAELDRLSGQAVMTSRFARTVERDMDGVASSTKRADTSINQLSGRLSLLARLAAVLGPGLVPIGAVGVAGVAGLASQFGFAAAGALSLVVAAQGVGDALKAVEDARLDPTAANLEKAEQAMAKLAPEAREFVARFQEIRPVLGDLQKSAAAGWFPGLTEALDSIETAAPTIERILLAVSTAGGDLIADGAKSLAGDRWADFFDFIEAEAPDAITALGQAVGSLTHGLASLWMAMDPVNDGVRDWLVDVTKSFDDWASSLDEGDVQGFFNYLSETGPKVAAAAGAIANAILQIAEAAAPLGGPVLDGLTAVAKAIATIADSPLGTPIMAAVTAMSGLSLASRGVETVLGAVNSRLAATGVQAGNTATRLASLNGVRFAGLLAALTLLDQTFEEIFNTRVKSTDLQRNLEALTRGTVSDDLKRVSEDLKIVTNGWNDAAEPIQEVIRLGGLLGDTPMDKAADNLEQIDQALAAMVESGNAQMAWSIFDQLMEIVRQDGGSQKDLIKQFDAFGTAAANVSSATDGTADSSRRAAREQEILRSRLVAARDAARESGKAFLDFSDSLAGEKFSMSGWLEGFEAQVRALADFRDNLQTLRDRGLDPKVIAELQAQGPAAAQAVAGLAKGAPENIERLNAAMRTAGKEIRGMGKDAKDAEKNVQDLGNKNAKPKVGLDAKGFDNKRAAVDADLDRTGGKTAKPKADLNTKPFKSGIQTVKSELTGATRLGAKPKVTLFGVPGAEAQLASLTRPRTINIRTNVLGAPANKFATDMGYADGGYTGDGGKYEPAGIVHRGEVVLPQETVKRDWGLLSSRYGHLPGFAGGGMVGNPSWAPAPGAGGKPGKDKSWLPAEFMELFELPKTLKGLNKALKTSQTALERETEARDELASKMSSLQDAVAGKLTSDLFGETEAWSAGGSFEDVMAILAGDISTGTQLQKDIAALQKKGLNGGALDALLAQGDAATIGTFAGLSAAQLAQYEKQFDRRADLATATGKNASAAAYGPEFKVLDSSVRRLETQVKAIEKAIDRNGEKNRESRQRGNSKGHRGRNGK